MSIQKQNSFILELTLLSRILRSSLLFDRKTLRLIGERHLFLEKTILPLIPHEAFSSALTKETLKEAYNSRIDFIHSLQDAFVEKNERFISCLKKMGLTRNEINICCLLTLGFKGKDIGLLTNNPNLYNNSSSIRRKLGLEKHDTNIGNYLRKLFTIIEQ